MSIRKAALADSAEILSIYASYVTDTCITFETEVPTVDAFTARIEKIMSNYPCLVYEENEKILGYAYASKHRERAAYQYSADVSVYVDQAYHRRGIGNVLYAKLLEILIEQGRIYTVYAGIALPNEKSVGLHKALGFKEVGVYHNVGYKFNKWINVIWLEKSIREYD